MDIKLVRSNVKQLNIDGIQLQCDTMDLESNRVLDDFQRRYSSGIRFDEEFMEDCKEVINTVLGPDAYLNLFAENEKSMVPYYLVQNLLSIYQDDFMKEAREKEKARLENEVNKVKQITDSFNKFAKQFEKAESKNYVVNKKRATNKRNHR